MKINSITLCIAMALIGLSACSRKPVIPIFETITIDSLIGSSANGCKIEYRFLTIANANKSKILETIEAENIAYFFELEEFQGDARQAADKAIGELAAEIVFPGAVVEGEVSVEAEACVVDSLLTYTISRYSYTGGAHGLYGTVNHTYSLNGGYELMLSDLFSDDQRGQLDSLIRTKLYEQYNANDDSKLSEQGFFTDCIAASENFRITGSGMIFFYNPYEIGCYALGGVEVSISREEMAIVNPIYAVVANGSK